MLKISKYINILLHNLSRWWCHFDDDNYVNTEKLVALLDNFNFSESFYVGRRSRYAKDYMTVG